MHSKLHEWLMDNAGSHGVKTYELCLCPFCKYMIVLDSAGRPATDSNPVFASCPCSLGKYDDKITVLKSPALVSVLSAFSETPYTHVVGNGYFTNDGRLIPIAFLSPYICAKISLELDGRGYYKGQAFNMGDMSEINLTNAFQPFHGQNLRGILRTSGHGSVQSAGWDTLNLLMYKSLQLAEEDKYERYPNSGELYMSDISHG